MDRLLAPAIQACTDGAPVPQVIASEWALAEQEFADKPGFAATFLPGGRAPREGALFRNPGLARSLTAIANDSASSMSQAWHDCMHNNPKWLPEDAPVADRRWRLKIYAMQNDPTLLLARVGKDFPNARHLKPIDRVPTKAPTAPE